MSETPKPDQGPALAKLWVLMVTAFVDMIGFALIMPLLPYYATDFGADAFTVGLLMATFAFGQMVMAPVWGRVSDLIGRKPVMLIGQGVAAGAFVVFAFSTTVWMLFACRLLQGMGAGSIGSINAYVSDAVGPSKRAEALGWITACTSAGVMIGPAIASLTVGFSRAAPGLIAAAASLLSMVFTWIWLREMKDPKKRTSKPRAIRHQMASILRHPAKRTNSLVWIYTAGMMAFMSMTGIMALYLDARFGIDEQQIGFFYLAVGAVSVVMRGLLLGKLVRRIGEVRTLRLGALCLGLGMLGITFAVEPWMFAVVLVLVPAGTAMLFPSTTSLISRYADPDEVGQTMGVQQAFGGISRLTAPIWAGAVFQHMGIREPFWIGGALVLLTALFALRLKPGENPHEDAPGSTPAEAATGG
ncbi:MAG: MFS transporter [Acidobacteriota bacterium]